MSLITDTQLADEFGVTVKRLHSMRRYHHWPCVKLGREVRFTPEQVAHIIATQTVTPDQPTARPVAAKGQTARSAARGRR